MTKVAHFYILSNFVFNQLNNTMKEFVRTTLAVMAGLFLMGIIGFFFLIAIIGGLSMASTQRAPIPKHGILRIDMADFNLGEQSQSTDVISSIQGGTKETIGLWDAIKSIEKAQDDPAIEYIYLKTDGSSTGIAAKEEFRQALSRFRSSGKAVIAYVENPTCGSFYLSSVADKVYMTSSHGISAMMTGVSSQLVFLKDILDKLGVNVQLIRHGKYKSAGEMFTKSASSPENLEQNQVMVEGIWNHICQVTAESRGISAEAYNDMVDNLCLNLPEDFLANRLVDELVTRDQLKERLTALAVADKFEDIKFIQFTDYVAAVKANAIKTPAKSIAIIYANGEIVDGDYDLQKVAGDYFAEQVAAARADSSVKAVVLRVNSPGGSVLASEKIKKEIDLLQKDKPVIASYGALAASGGYWISNGCDKIFSDATTLTGSIGVFGMIPDFSKTAKNLLHVGIQAVNSNKHSDMFSLMRPFDAAETAYMQRSIEDIYSLFVGMVADGRGLSPDYVDSIAQGRVWVGSDALNLKLVDEIGGLQDAVLYAASAAGDSNPDNFNIKSFPAEKTMIENIIEMFSNMKNDKTIFAGTPFESIEKTVTSWKGNWKKNKKDVFFARMPYEIIIM